MREFEEEWGERVSIVNYCDNFLILGYSHTDVNAAIVTLSALLARRMVDVNSLHCENGIQCLEHGANYIKHRIAKNDREPIISVSRRTRDNFIDEIRDRFDRLNDIERRKITKQQQLKLEQDDLEKWLLRHLPRYKNSAASYDELRVFACIVDFLEVSLGCFADLEEYLLDKWPEHAELRSNSLNGNILQSYVWIEDEIEGSLVNYADACEGPCWWIKELNS